MVLLGKTMGKDIYPFTVEPDGDLGEDEVVALDAWCDEEIGQGRWVRLRNQHAFSFLTEQDRLLFILRWSGSEVG